MYMSMVEVYRVKGHRLQRLDGDKWVTLQRTWSAHRVLARSVFGSKGTRSFTVPMGGFNGADVLVKGVECDHLRLHNCEGDAVVCASRVLLRATIITRPGEPVGRLDRWRAAWALWTGTRSPCLKVGEERDEHRHVCRACFDSMRGSVLPGDEACKLVPS